MLPECSCQPSSTLIQKFCRYYYSSGSLIMAVQYFAAVSHKRATSDKSHSQLRPQFLPSPSLEPSHFVYISRKDTGQFGSGDPKRCNRSSPSHGKDKAFLPPGPAVCRSKPTVDLTLTVICWIQDMHAPSTNENAAFSTLSVLPYFSPQTTTIVEYHNVHSMALLLQRDSSHGL